LRKTDLNPRAAAAAGDPAEAAAGAVQLALLPDDGPTGEFFSWNGTPVHGEPTQRPPPEPATQRQSRTDRAAADADVVSVAGGEPEVEIVAVDMPVE
jgi:hypothetical protein